MTRKTFLTRESFVDATEQYTREMLYSLPGYKANIQLLSENKAIECMKFTYEIAEKGLFYNIAVTVLPLNEQYTRISLKASHANGHTFYKDAELAFALHDFESTVHAAIKGDLTYFSSNVQKSAEPNRLQQLWQALKPAMVNTFLKKKLS